MPTERSHLKKGQNIVLVGGAGQMGQLFARLLLAQGYPIQVLDRDDWGKANELFSGADAVLICVSLDQTVSVIKKVAALLSSNSNTVLVDLSSQKKAALQALTTFYQGPSAGLHPLFGPTLQNPQGHSMVWCEGKKADQCEWLKKAFQELGFNLIDLSAEQHDRCMDTVQGVQHLINCGLGFFLKDQAADMSLLEATATPTHQVQLGLMERIFYQDAALYADILSADPSRIQTLRSFIKTLERMVDTLETGHRESFIKEFKTVHHFLGPLSATGQAWTDELFKHPLFSLRKLV